MAKKKASGPEQLNIKGALLKGPKFIVQGLQSTLHGLPMTKVIQTWIVEQDNLKIQIVNNGAKAFEGTVKWIGNRTDGIKGTAICIKNKKDLRVINPTADNIKDAVLNVEKMAIGINAISQTKCSVCGKEISIFDNPKSCPICNAPGHDDHLLEWVKMRHNCPICKGGLEVFNDTELVETDE